MDPSPQSPLRPSYNEPENFVLKDSGERQQFDTGAVRDTQVGKGRYDLFSPFALMRQAIIAQKGAIKYTDRNWEKGMPISRFLDSALRHIFQYIAGMSDEDHLAQAAWNIHGAMHMEEMVIRGRLDASIIDLPDYGLPPAAVPSVDADPQAIPFDKAKLKATIKDALKAQMEEELAKANARAETVHPKAEARPSPMG